MSLNKFLLLCAVLLLALPMMSSADVASSEQQSTGAQELPQHKANVADAEEDSASVIQSFATDQSAKSELVAIEDGTKRLVMFIMGVPLLILIFITAALGVAMGVYGKPVFVAHMVCAGLSLTLALGHAVVGIVWFYPF